MSLLKRTENIAPREKPKYVEDLPAQRQTKKRLLERIKRLKEENEMMQGFLHLRDVQEIQNMGGKITWH